jgi:hypothetical protein
MNSVIISFPSPLVKTVHVEKEVLLCDREDVPSVVVVDVNVYTDIIEDLKSQNILQVSFEVDTCVKDFNGSVLQCLSKEPPIPLPSLKCSIQESPLRFPMEMNTVAPRSGPFANLVKTMNAEKEIFECGSDNRGYPIIKEVTIFTEKFENIDISPLSISKKNSFISTICMKTTYNATVFACDFSQKRI